MTDLLARAAADYAAGRLDDSLRLVAEAERLDPDQLRLLELKGAIALAQGRAQEAGAALTRAAERARATTGRELPNLRLSQATALEAAGDIDAAITALGIARTSVADTISELLSAETLRTQRTRLAEIDTRLARLCWARSRHDEAITAMARVAEAVPDDPATLGRLAGMLAWRLRLVEGLAVSLHAAALQPASGEPARNVAEFLLRLGAPQGAKTWLHLALARTPDDAKASAILATTSAAAGAPPASPLLAAATALAESPDSAAAHATLADALLDPQEADRHGTDWPLLARGAAIALLRRAQALRPAQPIGTTALADALAARGELAAAETALRAALKQAPLDPELHKRLAALLQRAWRLEEAAASYADALGLEPDNPELMTRLANALLSRGPSARALALLQRAIALAPQSIETRYLLGIALTGQHRPDEAEPHLRTAVASQPDNGGWHFALAMALLLQGKMEEAWPEYAWRWRLAENTGTRRTPADPFRRPDPAAWNGRTVLLYAEQGLGDTLQFLRYARLVKECGAQVHLEVPAGIKSLARNIPGLAGVHADTEGVPPHDEAVPLLHLPWAFGTGLASIPATVPYLRPDLTRAAAFRRRMQGLPGLKVGLVWSGDPRPHSHLQSTMDRRRSLRLDSFAPLAAVPGLIFVSLQKGAPAAQAATPPNGMVLHDWTAELEDFAATAALMAALDLIITVDTAPAHLAGALGREVWLLNRYDTDWRWLLGRDDSPWYPTMRQFRQATPGDWDGVIARVADALRARRA
jgi:tetratricopeptide (TPR) repeat protein